jgi:hypothetical protein
MFLVLRRFKLDGYEINLPQLVEKPEPDALSVKKLLDIKDGGSLGMEFRIYEKMRKARKTVEVVHIIEFKRIDELVDTLC